MNADAPLVEPFTVLRVVDTRAYIEDDDRWIAVAGSGDSHECGRCGRRHEVHAYIEDATGRQDIVGVGCMNADRATARRLADRAAGDARAAARAADRADAAARLAAVAAAVPPFPADRVERGVVPDGEPFAGKRFWAVDGARCWGFADADDDERLRCLRDTWTRRVAADAVGGPDALRDLERRAGTMLDLPD